MIVRVHGYDGEADLIIFESETQARYHHLQEPFYVSPVYSIFSEILECYRFEMGAGVRVEP